MPRPFPQIVNDARRKVAFTHREFAELTGVSLRTVQRHAHAGGISGPFQTQKLLAALHPIDPALARELAEAAGLDLAALGLGIPPAPVEARPEHADSVLLAAADAMHLAPEAVRPALAAIFARARELNVNPASLAPHFLPPGQSAEAPSASSGRGSLP